MVIIGWDSAIRLQQDFRWFMNLVFSKNAGRDRRVNPNGCPAVGTFFPTHIYSDLYGLQYLYYQGHEMSTLSITQKLPSQWWSRASIDQLNEEISNHRVILDLFSGVNPATVQGARMPYLEVNNNYFQMLIESGFSWDSSLPTQQVSPPMWPHTLDFRTPLTDECIVLGCPTLTFPGLWEFPLIDWTHPNGTICGNVPDACPHYDTEKETYEWLRVNYDRHARGNRAPFTLNLRAAWFEADLIDYGGTGARAMSRFLDELEADDSVYFVSVSQALAWMRNPTPLSTIRSFAPWLWCDADGVRKDLTLPLCTVTQATEQCVYNVTQPYWQEPQEVSYYTCAECSPEWPSPGNPRGDPRL
ncbi:PREDICTED: uncharacterized protein LOC106817350 [Priapulus caudatus]|uniref:Uncharacterized protein LOC106817350 n=1 Tax=Priapulus caudatus TaxID=37621 RepID=A0ABM1EZ73_PRICU|nr:PREDICTED: uncharacterized protein LOC106817350 [Priapulus caudatus]